MGTRAISSDGLSNLLRSNSRTEVLCVDTRSMLQYNDNHIQGAINICCSKIIRRKLQNNKISIKDLVRNNNVIGVKGEWKRLKYAVVYDEASSWERKNSFHPNHVLYILVEKLLDCVWNVALLEGGFSEFSYKFPKLCDSKIKSTCPLLSISTPCASGSVNCPPTKVLPFLYLGSEEDAHSEDVLKTCKVKYILNASQTAVDSPYCKTGHYLKIPIQDNSSENIVAWFQTAFDFIDKVKESDDHILIHCVGGVSRSATIAIAYVMRHLSLSLDNAYRYVKEKRPTISPNLNFMGQLLQYEQQLLQETSLINIPFSELNLEGMRSPTEILRKSLVLAEDRLPHEEIDNFPSPGSEDLVPSPALDLLDDEKERDNCLSSSAFSEAACTYSNRLEVFPSPGSDDVPSPTGSELSNCSEYYDNSAPSHHAPSKPLTLDLGIVKIPSKTFTLELNTKKR